MIFQLDDRLWFPNPHLADPDGLLAVGGDLSTERLLLAYSWGIFPWYSFRDNPEKLWFCPHERFVIFPEEIHISHSMRTMMNKKCFRTSFNEDFDAVIHHCSRLRYNESGAWLGDEMIEAYRTLHRKGFAHSAEVWYNDGTEERLAGGLYGVCLRKAFFGESMFSLMPSASKLALIHLAKTMAEQGGTLIDCQMQTPHLKSMGGKSIDYDTYLKLIRQ